MDLNQFRVCAKQMVDYVADYIETVADRRVMADVQPGYLRSMMPDHAPQEPDKWEDVMKDIEKVIMPGVSHWLSPDFHGYFPTGFSLTSTVADILSDGISCIGFSWITCPAATELEMMVMDWLAKILTLPKEYLFSNNTNGGGVIVGSASEATLINLFCARNRMIHQIQQKEPEMDKYDIMRKLVAYGSDQAHSSVERACLLAGIDFHCVKSDEKARLRGKALEEAVREDKEKGKIPFYAVATLGTTTSCAFDDLSEVGPICKKENIWLHVDAAYAGAAFVCPEYQHFLNGVDYVESFSFNPHKWLLITFDCSAMWVKNSDQLVEAFKVLPSYLKYGTQNQVPDYRHWQISFGRRFRSLKLWFVMRLYGIQGLQAYIRKHVQLAKEFEEIVRKDPDFEISAPVILSIVCFRLKGPNEWSEELLKLINGNGVICMSSGVVHGTYMLRFTISSYEPASEHSTRAWKEIRKMADVILLKHRNK